MKEIRQSPRLLPWPELERRVPYTRQHLGRLEKLDLFPRRVQVGGNRVAWIESEIDAWIEARVAERGKAA
jgi:prophage regulatory protein